QQACTTLSKAAHKKKRPEMPLPAFFRFVTFYIFSLTYINLSAIYKIQMYDTLILQPNFFLTFSSSKQGLPIYQEDNKRLKISASSFKMLKITPPHCTKYNILCIFSPVCQLLYFYKNTHPRT
ncbi:MAG: hypothetical protein IJY00_01920, partial [Bacteroidaceae bacterium]|nr:hypothetical protein [Bacteroidaceae bacterium]